MSIESRKRIAVKIQAKFGDVNDLLNKENDINEVMLNSDSYIWIDTLEHGMSKRAISFTTDAAILSMSSIATYNGTVINKANPLLKASLPWGSVFKQ